ncbi:MAG: homocysteine S-methyltransferase family protein [Rhodospirillales bacterium]
MTTEVTLLDGGMGQELYRRSGQPASPLWSAQVMRERPDLVVELHREFIAAGAEVIAINAYTATPQRLARDADASLFEPLQHAALDAAAAARDGADRPVRIAGCLPPLMASYRADVVPDAQTLLDTYRRIVDIQNGGVDLYMGETLSTVREVSAATAAAGATGKPVWTSMTVDDADGTRLRSGEPLADGVAAAQDAGASAVLVNCSIPEAIGQAMAVLAESGLPFGGYANGFTSIAALAPGGTVDGLEARSDLGPDAYAGHVMGWVRDGAAIVGGCCEVGPAHIAAIATALGKSP